MVFATEKSLHESACPEMQSANLSQYVGGKHVHSIGEEIV
jgi:hypothetical protein